MKRRNVRVLIAVLMATGLFSFAAATGSASSRLIVDNFKEKEATEITDHDPKTDVVGGGWSVVLGTWELKKGKARELSTAPVVVSSDYQAVIDAGTSDTSVILKLNINKKSDQFWGVVTRYSGTRDWIMAFHDGVGDLVLGKKRPNEDESGADVGIESETAGGFQELGRVPVKWKKGRHKITLTTTGDKIVVYAGKKLVLTAFDDEGMSSTVVGIFSRGTGKNKFEKFTVNQN